MVAIGLTLWEIDTSTSDLIIGEAESAELDTVTWQVTSFYVSLNDDASTKLGCDRPYFGKIFICLPVSTVKEIGDFVMLNKTFAELQEMRQCKK